ncbi:MAG: RNA-binding protein, partial [Janthinobacterium sp.]
DKVPRIVHAALEQALEISLANVPRIAGKVVVCPDVSGSMASPVSGFRGSATSHVRCIDVAALVAAAMLRKNPDAVVLPFEHNVVQCALGADDSVMENAAKLAAIGGGGTNCSAPLLRMNGRKELADLVIYVSDNESWIDAKRSGATATMGQWHVFKQRNPQAKLVCIDIAPHATTQAMEREDILNIGGFSDDVFRIIAAFAAGQLDPAHWVGEIATIDIAAPAG